MTITSCQLYHFISKHLKNGESGMKVANVAKMRANVSPDMLEVSTTADEMTHSSPLVHPTLSNREDINLLFQLSAIIYQGIKSRFNQSEYITLHQSDSTLEATKAPAAVALSDGIDVLVKTSHRHMAKCCIETVRKNQRVCQTSWRHRTDNHIRNYEHSVPLLQRKCDGIEPSYLQI